METTQQQKIRPTFGDSFSHGWKVMFDNFLVLLLVVIVVGIIFAPLQIFKINFRMDDFHHNFDWYEFIRSGTFIALGILALILGLIALVYGLLIVPVFKFGSDIIFVHAVRGIRPQFELLIQGFKENYLYIVLANLLTIALIMLAAIFLIIPGIIIACRLAFVSYLVMDKKLDPIVAVEESWKMTRGHGWTIFFMAFVSIFIFLLGLIMIFVGVLPAIMWIKGSFASLYEAVLTEKEAKAAVAV